jgi:TonB-linked SusC/RagA family outer membrane protein
LKTIEKESEFRFFYNDDFTDLDKKLTFSVSQKSIDDLMSFVLDNTEVSYKVLDNNFIVITPKSLLQQRLVTGIVYDENGNPLPGANIQIAGTTTGAITDMNGKYTIEISDENAVLIFSFIGFISKTEPVASRSVINITLIPDITRLDEVVVVGYGTVKKSDLTGSVSSIRPEELMKRHPISLAQGMQGMAAGVQIVRKSGAPEGGTSIHIRGIATINNSAEPLYVVDGIMVGTEADFLNPNDIEKIEILKDASATAIYGARGANGVIMITTKKGSKGKTNLTFDASFGVQNQRTFIDVANAEQFASAANKVAANDGSAVNPVWANPSALNSINWQKEMVRPSLLQQYSLSASGGTENTQALLSVGYLGNEGVVRASSFNRLTARTNISHKIKDFINAGLNVSYTRSESKGQPRSETQDGGNQMNYATLIPTMDTLSDGTLLHVPIKYADGTWGHFPRENDYNSPGADNPLAVANEADWKLSNNRILANATVEVALFKVLTFKSVGGFNYSGTSTNNYEVRNFRTFYTNPTDDYSMNQHNSMEYILENYLTYNQTFGKHRFTALLGHSVSKGSSEDVNARSSDFPVSTIRNIGLTQAPETIFGDGGLGIDTREQSFFGRMIYSFDDRYLLTATVRRDGSSNFGAGNKYGTFPSVSLGWRISEEDFMKNQQIFSVLKLRAGWGQTGNAGNPTNLSVDQLSSSRITYYLYNQLNNTFGVAPGLAQLDEIDTNLKWETNEQTNIGVDMAFLKNTLTVTADYFRRDAKDLLLQRGLRPSTGFSEIYTNAGHIRNTGFELQVGYQKRWSDWGLNVNANATTIKNEAVDIGADIYSNNDVYTGAWWSSYSITRNGYPVGSYFGWRSDGIFQTQAEIDALNANAIAKGASKGAYQSIGTKPGDRKFKDLDNNGWVDDEDREILGNGYPKLTYAVNTSLSYKNLDFNLSLYGVAGQNILSYSYHDLIGFGTNNLLADYAVNAWDGEGSTNVYPRLTKADPNHNGQISDAFIRKGGFLKVQNIQVGYTFPKSIIDPMKMESIRVFVSVENLLTISKYDLGDPEVGNGNVQQTGFDGGRYPFPRIWTLGINFGF